MTPQTTDTETDMATFLCWHLPDGTPERGDEIEASHPAEAAQEFAQRFFHDSEGEWLGGGIMIQLLDAHLDGVGAAIRFDADVALSDLAITVREDGETRALATSPSV